MDDGILLPDWWTFFFKAEDGIRDFHVTGVQTCALPISLSSSFCGTSLLVCAFLCLMISATAGGTCIAVINFCAIFRSEERRVGKECRSRGETDGDKEIINGSQ